MMLGDKRAVFIKMSRDPQIYSVLTYADFEMLKQVLLV
jgi:hypothetical protein